VTPARRGFLRGLGPALLGMAFAPAARARCERALVVPVAPTGFNVQVLPDGQVRGVYPDLLRSLEPALGCSFSFPIVPRPRQSLMFFETGEADLFLPASRTAERDQKAEFLPMLRLTPTLITFGASTEAPPASVEALVARKEWRAVVVRSYTWGSEYERLLRRLEEQHRVDVVADLKTLGQMLRAGRVQFTILPPTLLHSALQDGISEARATQDFRFQLLSGLPPSEVGTYLSTSTLDAETRRRLRRLIEQALAEGRLLQIMGRYYPAEVLKADVQRL